MTPTHSAAIAVAAIGENFDGPLDFLLAEVRRQNVAIEEVRMAPITSRFLEYLQSAAERNLNLDIDWLLMAATLIYWKSQALLPISTGADAEDRIPDELQQQLLAHKKQLAVDLQRRQAITAASFSRAADPAGGTEIAQRDQPLRTTVWDLIQQAREMSMWVEQHRSDLSITRALSLNPDDVTVAEMVDYLRDEFAATNHYPLNANVLLNRQTTPARRSALFLAMLEMANNQDLEIVQDACFAPMSLVPRGCPATPRN